MTEDQTTDDRTTDEPEEDKSAEVAVSPRSRENAEALLAAADKLGYEPDVVRTQHNGYLVPRDVAERFQAMLNGEIDEPVEDEPETPDESWNNDKIRAYADENKIDLGDNTKKADMLAAIAAAEKE